MNETDNPLKRLVTTSIIDFAEWILDAKVDHVETANIELQADPTPIYSDLLFWVTLTEKDKDGSPIRVLLHIEFQGKSSRKPMRLRMLDYIVRIQDSVRGVRIHSVVFYIGDGVGAQDSGLHQLLGMKDHVTLQWHYEVVHLWKIAPEDLLKLKRPGLLPLIGQTKIKNPDALIPQIYSEIKTVLSEETQHRLLTELLALLKDEEITKMVETLIEKDEWVLDTPYLRRWRTQIEEAQKEAEEVQHQLEETKHELEVKDHELEVKDHELEVKDHELEEKDHELEEKDHQVKKMKFQAEQAALQAEKAQNRAEMIEQQLRAYVELELKVEREQWRTTRRQDVMNLVAARYNPPLQKALQLQKYLMAIGDDEKFSSIFEATATAEDYDKFYSVVAEVASNQDTAQAI